MLSVILSYGFRFIYFLCLSFLLKEEKGSSRSSYWLEYRDSVSSTEAEPYSEKKIIVMINADKKSPNLVPSSHDLYTLTLVGYACRNLIFSYSFTLSDRSLSVSFVNIWACCWYATHCWKNWVPVSIFMRRYQEAHVCCTSYFNLCEYFKRKCTASNSVALILNLSLWLCTIGNSESAAVFNISGVTGPVEIWTSGFIAQTSNTQWNSFTIFRPGKSNTITQNPTSCIFIHQRIKFNVTYFQWGSYWTVLFL